MAIEMPEQQPVDLVPTRGSKIQDADTYARPALPTDNGDAERLSSSLKSLGANIGELGAANEKQKIEQQKQNMDLYVAQVQAGMKNGVYDPNAANNITSPLHPAVRALVSQAVGVNQGQIDAQKEELPPDALLYPEKANAWIQQKTADKLNQIGSVPFYSSGYMQSYRAGLTSLLGQGANIRRDLNNKQIIDGAVTGVGAAGAPGSQIDTSKAGSPADAAAVATAARNLGVSPVAVAAVISYESGFNANIKGPVTKWGQHQGAIQFGQPQAQKYGYNGNMTIAQQGPMIEAYLRDHGVKPGMGLSQIYAAVNAGNANYAAVKDRSDGYGTVEQHVNKIMASHIQKATAWLGLATQVNPAKSADASGTASGKPVQLAGATPTPDTQDPTVEGSGSNDSGIVPKPIPRPGNGGDLPSSIPVEPMKPRPQDPQEAPAAPAPAPAPSPFSDKSPAPVAKGDGTTSYSGGWDAYHEYQQKQKAGEKVTWDGAAPATFKPDQPTPQQRAQATQIKYGIDPQVAVNLPEAALNMNHRYITEDGQIKSVTPELAAKTRDSVAQQFVLAATAARDPKYLEAFPPNLQTPEIKTAFLQAQQSIHRLVRQDLKEQQEDDAQARADATREVKDRITQKFANGEKIDPAKDSVGKDGKPDTDGLAYALKMQDQNRMPAVDSSTRYQKLSNQIAGAFGTDNYSKLFPDLKPGQSPTTDMVMDLIRNDDHMNSGDIQKLQAEAPKLINAYTMMQQPDIKEYYTGHVETDVKSYMSSVFGKGDKILDNNIAGRVQTAWETELRTQWKGYLEDHNMNPPIGSAKIAILKEAEKKAMEAFERAKGGDTPPPPPAATGGGGAKPAAAAAAGARTVNVTGPDGKPAQITVTKPTPAATPAPTVNHNVTISVPSVKDILSGD